MRYSGRVTDMEPDPRRWEAIRTHFAEALAAQPADRGALLDRGCGSDAELRRDVVALLDAHARAGTFLDASLVCLLPPSSSDLLSSVQPGLWGGRRVGAYRIVREIGQGGMGQVFLAERADALFEKRVAVKVVRLTGGADALAARFARERQILASLDHPNITRILDAGLTDEKVPFVVMEYVDGVAIDDYCDSHELEVRARLELFCRVCLAVHAAHARGVIHRDLKPANILVTAEGVPKLLDFGIAKVIESDPADARMTQTVQRVLTPLTAAPEQLSGGATTPATDVYALGVLLYRLLTGEYPFHEEGQTPAALEQAIRQRLPPRPSERLKTTGLGASVHARAAADLDHIVLKALRKNPAERYASTDLFTADIRRWLAGGRLVGGAGFSLWLARGLAAHRVTRAVVAAIVLASVAAMAMVGTFSGWWAPGHGDGDAAADVRHQQITFSGDVHSTALSPDGRSLAYASGHDGESMQLFVRDIASGQDVEIWKGAQVDHLAWTPDGAHVLFSGVAADSFATWLIPRVGGPARPIRPGGSTVAIAPDGSRLALAWLNEIGFRVVSFADGTSRDVKLSGFQWNLALAWARADLLFVLTATDDNRYVVWSTTPEGGAAREVYADDLPLKGLCVSPIADVVYTLRERRGSGELLGIPFRGGVAAPLLSGLPVPVSDELWLQCSVSADGRRFAYTRGSTHANLWQADLTRPGAAPSPLTRGTSVYSLPSVSPDGRWILATEGAESSAQIMKLPVAGGRAARLAAGRGAVWSPDGSRLAFASIHEGSQRVWLGDADGLNLVELPDSRVSNPLLWWLPDGRLAFQTPDARNYRIRDLASGREEWLVREEARGFVFSPLFSRRGDRIAVSWNRTPRGLWLLTWPAREERHLAAELRPIGWSVDDRWIYAQSMGRGSTIARVSVADGRIEPLISFSVGHLDHHCAMTPDATRVVCPVKEQNTDVWVIDDFDAAARTVAR